MDAREVVDRLESLQYDILFWMRKEKSEKVKEKLSFYDNYIEQLIDDLAE